MSVSTYFQKLIKKGVARKLDNSYESRMKSGGLTYEQAAQDTTP